MLQYDCPFRIISASGISSYSADIAAMDVRFAPNVTKEYNAELCSLMGVTVPEDYVAIP